MKIERLSPALGAIISGIDLNATLNGEAQQGLQAALVEHQVLFLRQQFLQAEQQRDLALLFGDLHIHPIYPAHERVAEVMVLDSHKQDLRDNELWHTDVTFQAAYPQVCVLRAVTLPDHGGDTVWANTVAAYEGLPEPLKQLAEQLWAVHGNDYDYAENFRQNAASDSETAGRASYRKVFTRKTIEAEQPLVHVHPETGEKALLLGHFAKRIKGLRSSESAALLQLFNERIIRLENTVRWSWQEGDVAVWDNRATQHYAINDYGDAHRVMRRVTVSGTTATSVDGRRSLDITAAETAAA